MPGKKRTIGGDFDWINSVQDMCLFDTLAEAHAARASAEHHGALQRRVCARSFKSGDATLEQIKRAVQRGQESSALCRKAAAALRRYNTAGECVVPSHKRGRR